MNPNNCETCEYKSLKSPDQDDDGHCYMFRDEPQEVCMQHTGRQARKKLVTLFMLGSMLESATDEKGQTRND